MWDVSNPNEQEPQCIRVVDGLIGEEESDAITQCHAVWHPSGRYFVVGTKSHGMTTPSYRPRRIKAKHNEPQKSSSFHEKPGSEKVSSTRMVTMV